MFKIDLENLAEINVILSALGKLPLEQAFPVWQKIKKQAEEQLTEKE